MSKVLIEFTAFGETRRVNATLHNMKEGETPEAYLWVERAESLYALSGKDLKGKRVAVINRADWMMAETVKT